MTWNGDVRPLRRPPPHSVTAPTDKPNSRPMLTLYGVREIAAIGAELARLVDWYGDVVTRAEADPRRGHYGLAEQVERLERRVSELAERMQPVARRDAKTGITRCVAYRRHVG